MRLLSLRKRRKCSPKASINRPSTLGIKGSARPRPGPGRASGRPARAGRAARRSTRRADRRRSRIRSQKSAHPHAPSISGSADLTQPAGVEVVQEPADGDVAQERPGPHPLDVVGQRSLLVGGGEERDAAGVRTTGVADRLGGCPPRCRRPSGSRCARRPSPGVRRAETRPGARVRSTSSVTRAPACADLGVPRREPEHVQRVNPRRPCRSRTARPRAAVASSPPCW